MSWRIKNSWWLTNNLFNKKLRIFQSNISSQLWWNRWGLESGPKRALTETPVQFTDGHDILKGPSSMAMAIPWHPSLASDGSVMVHRWFRKKFWKIR